MVDEKEKDQELAAAQEAARTQVQAQAATAAETRAQQDAAAMQSLEASQKAQEDALAAYNQQQYANMGQILSEVQAKKQNYAALDETARKKENAYRYITGVGDTLSSLANLVGVAELGASNQQQTYNSSKLVEKAEAARKERQLNIENLSKRLDELKARKADMESAGSLKEAELKAQNAQKKLEMQESQRKEGEAEKRYWHSQEQDAINKATSQWNADRTYNAQQKAADLSAEQWQKSYDLKVREFEDKQKDNFYNFTLRDESIDVPKTKVNETNVERIFKMLPEDIQKKVVGKLVTTYETDEFGKSHRVTSNEQPTLSQKLAAIGAYADNDENIKRELRSLAGITTETKGKKKVW